LKKTGILNSNISRVVADMGHTDWLGIGDAGTPVPKGIEKIDLAVHAGLPSFIEVLKETLKELNIQKIYLAEEIKVQNPEQLKKIKQVLSNIEIEYVSHSELKKMMGNAKAFVRTGEETPFSNIILESGVIF